MTKKATESVINASRVPRSFKKYLDDLVRQASEPLGLREKLKRVYYVDRRYGDISIKTWPIYSVRAVYPQSIRGRVYDVVMVFYITPSFGEKIG